MTMLSSPSFTLKKPIASRLFSAVMLCLVFLAAPHALAQAAPSAELTEQDSVRLGLARPDIAAVMEATLETARSEVQGAARWPNPVLSYQRESMPGIPGRTVEKTYQLSQQLDLAGRRGLRRDAAEERLAATQADAERRRLDIVAEIRRRFYEALYRQQLLLATREWESRMAAIAGTVTKLYQGGEVAGYDRRRIALERTAAQARLRSEQAEYEKAWQRLAALLGTSSQASVLRGDLLPPQAPPLDTVLARLDRHPELRALARRAGAFDLERRAAQRGWIPDVTVGLGQKTIDQGGAHDTGTVVSLSLPLPLFDRNQPEQQRAAAQAETMRGEERLLRNRLEGEVRGGWAQWRELQAAASDYRSQSAGAAQELARIAETSYRGGETGILELLDAYRAALDADGRALELAWNARQATIELESLAGNITP